MLKNVEQIEADICEIYLTLRTCREFNSFNSDFHFFPEKQELITVNSQACAIKGRPTVLKEFIKK